MEMKCAQNLSHEVCGVIVTAVEQCASVQNSVHVRHASVEVQVQCVNVVIGVVLGGAACWCTRRSSFLL